MKEQILAAVVLATLSLSAFADAEVDASVSTLGYGLGVGVQLSDNLVARFGLNQFNRDFNTSADTLNLKGDLKLSSLDALLDWHLFDGATHLTVGILSNDSSLNMTAVPDSNGIYTINGVPYSAKLVGNLSGYVSFNKTSPYLGFGWSSQPKNKGLMLKSDFGVMYLGTLTAHLGYTGTYNATISKEVAAEEKSLNDKLSGYQYYPVISFGIGYAF